MKKLILLFAIFLFSLEISSQTTLINAPVVASPQDSILAVSATKRARHISFSSLQARLKLYFDTQYSSTSINLGDIGDVSIVAPTNQEVLTWNGSAWVNQVFGAGSETDPIYINDPAFSITSTDITNLSNLSGVNTGDQNLANYVTLDGTQTIPGIKTYLNASFLLRNVANTFNGSFINTNTGDRVYTLQDADGTIAFISDITGTNSGTNTGDQDLSDYARLSIPNNFSTGNVFAEEIIVKDIDNNNVSKLALHDNVGVEKNSFWWNGTDSGITLGSGITKFKTTGSDSYYWENSSSVNIMSLSNGDLFVDGGLFVNGQYRQSNGIFNYRDLGTSLIDFSYFNTSNSMMGSLEITQDTYSFKDGINIEMLRVNKTSGIFGFVNTLALQQAESSSSKMLATIEYVRALSAGWDGSTNLDYTASPSGGLVTSDTGTDATIPLASGSNAGLMSSSEKDAIIANTAKVSNATHTGDVTGSTALTIANGVITIPKLSASGIPNGSTFLRGDNTWVNLPQTDENDFVTSGVLTGTDLVLSVPNQSDVTVDLSNIQSTPQDASGVNTDVTNFNGNLSGTDNTVQKALETLDELTSASGITNLNYIASPANGLVTSDTGSDATLTLANSTNAGLLSPSDYDEISVNTSKITNATHTGDVTGSTVLTIGDDRVVESKLDIINSPIDGYGLTYDGATGRFNWELVGNSADMPINMNVVEKSGIDYKTKTSEPGRYIIMKSQNNVDLDFNEGGDKSLGFNQVIFNDSGSDISLVSTDGNVIKGGNSIIPNGYHATYVLVDTSTPTWNVSTPVSGGSSSGVDSVNSLTGAVVLATGDISESGGNQYNQTHTGDVTGSTELTIQPDAVDIPMINATGTADGTTYLRGDGTWEVPPGGSGDGVTNLDYNPVTREVTSDTGTNATLTLVDGSNAGLISVSDKIKLDAIQGTNTGDQDLTSLSTKSMNFVSNVSNYVTALADNNKYISILVGDVTLNKTGLPSGFNQIIYNNSGGDINLVGDPVTGVNALIPNGYHATYVLEGTTWRVSTPVSGGSGGGISGSIASNQVAVGTGTDAIGGSSGLTYDGSTLDVDGTVEVSQDPSNDFEVGSRGYNDNRYMLTNSETDPIWVAAEGFVPRLNTSNLFTSYLDATAMWVHGGYTGSVGFRIFDSTSSVNRADFISTTSNVLGFTNSINETNGVHSEFVSYMGDLLIGSTNGIVRFLTPYTDMTSAQITGATDDTVLVSREWITDQGYGGSGAVTSVNTYDGVVVLDPDDLDDTSTTNKFVTGSDITNLGNLSGANTGDQTISLSGDISGSGTGPITTTIQSSAVDMSMINATGTPSSTSFLRGDGTWTAPSGLGDMLQSTYDNGTNGAISGVVDNAEAVNGHTVLKDVPSDADFGNDQLSEGDITSFGFMNVSSYDSNDDGRVNLADNSNQLGGHTWDEFYLVGEDIEMQLNNRIRFQDYENNSRFQEIYSDETNLYFRVQQYVDFGTQYETNYVMPVNGNNTFQVATTTDLNSYARLTGNNTFSNTNAFTSTSNTFTKNLRVGDGVSARVEFNDGFESTNDLVVQNGIYNFSVYSGGAFSVLSFGLNEVQAPFLSNADIDLVGDSSLLSRGYSDTYYRRKVEDVYIEGANFTTELVHSGTYIKMVGGSIVTLDELGGTGASLPIGFTQTLYNGTSNDIGFSSGDDFEGITSPLPPGYTATYTLTQANKWTITQSQPSGTGSQTLSLVGTQLYISDGNDISLASLGGGSGTVTEVYVGDGLDVVASTSTPSITLDFDELSDMASDITAVTQFILQSAGKESRKQVSEIKLSVFNNDAGWTDTPDPTTASIEALNFTQGPHTTNTDTQDLHWDPGTSILSLDSGGFVDLSGIGGSNYTAGSGIQINTNEISLGSLVGSGWTASNTYGISAKGFFDTSDRRLKNSIVQLDDTFVRFKWNSATDGFYHYGVIAQEVQKTNPEMIEVGKDGYLHVNYNEVLIKELVSLKKKLAELENRIKELENEK